MRIIEKITEMQEISLQFKSKKKSIGFVPTMGALHDGHISLVKASKEENDITAVSIFVNPIQFGPNEDFSRYPRTFAQDCKLLEQQKTDFLFFPTSEEMYGAGFQTSIDLKYLPNHLCGLKREGHFSGVATVVAKLFNIINPSVSYFGQKDYQQSVIIKRLVRDLNFSTAIKVMPIFRETDGLAMSSRNRYLSDAERKAAPVLNKALQLAEYRARNGEKKSEVILHEMKEMILKEAAFAEIDYINIVDPETLEDLAIIEHEAVAALAVFFGTTRLIDNTIIRF